MIDYNFNSLFKAIDMAIHNDNCEEPFNNPANKEYSCREVMAALNGFFADFKCLDVIYTRNTDKPLFGIFVRVIDVDPQTIIGGTVTTANTYQVEIDSRLVTDIGLSATEIGVLMLHDINALQGEAYSNIMIDAINAISAFGDNTLRINPEDRDMVAIFNLVCCITARNLTSIFCKPKAVLCDIEMVPDFIANYRLTGYYEEAVKALTAKAMSDIEAEYPALMLNWFASIVQNDNPGDGRYVKGLLRKALKYEASSLVRKAIMVVINTLDSYIPPMQGSYLQSLTEAKHGLISQMKRNGLRSLEDDLYEYNMRLRNVETQDDAILLMRQINSRMSILEDYLRDEPDLDEKERKRWEDCYQQYLDLRAALSKKTVYNKKMYGLFVDYNALQNMSQSGQLMNTYY